MVDIFTMAFNEELLIQFMIDHYRKNFPNCRIVVYDNQSTDNTAAIAKNNNCEVVEYNTNGQIDDEELRRLKNNFWKNSTSDWVLVCDIDELLDIDEHQLKNEESKASTIIKSEGYNMINMEDNYDFQNIKHGVREVMYDKYFLFNRKLIMDIGYMHGAHKAFPNGIIKLSDTAYKLRHYKYVNLQMLINRHKLTATRLSQQNIKNRWGWQVLQTPEQITNHWNSLRKQAIKILP